MVLYRKNFDSFLSTWQDTNTRIAKDKQTQAESNYESMRAEALKQANLAAGRNEDGSEKDFWTQVADKATELGKGIVGSGQRIAGTAAQGVYSLFALANLVAGDSEKAKQWVNRAEAFTEAKAIDGGSLSLMNKNTINGESVDKFAADIFKGGAEAATFFQPELKTGSLFAKVGSEVGVNSVMGGLSSAANQYSDTGTIDWGQVGSDAIQNGVTAGVLRGAREGVSAFKNRKTNVINKASTKLDDMGAPDEYKQALSTLYDAKLSTKDIKKATSNIVSDAEKRVNFETMADNATVGRQKLTDAVGDIDNSLKAIDTPEYQAENGLLNAKGAEKTYKTLIKDAQDIPEVKQATQELTAADDQIKYYNDLRVKSAFSRKVDSINKETAKIIAARERDVNGLQEMSKSGDVDPVAAEQMAKETMAKYDEMIKKQNDKLDELAKSDPNAAAEHQMLEQATEQATRQKMAAQDNLNKVMADKENLARQEATKVAQTPDPVAVEKHRVELEQKKAKLTKKIEDAKKRYEQPNENIDQTNQELADMKDGSHPLIEDGASREKLFTRYTELMDEKAKYEAGETLSQDPKKEMTVEQQTEVLDTALEEVSSKKTTLGAKLGRIWAQPANQLRAAGYKQLADLRTDAIVAANRFAYDQKIRIREWGKKAKGNSSKNLFRAANGDLRAYERLTPAGREVVDEWQKVRKDLGKQMGLPDELLERDYYIPHLFVDIAKQPKLIETQLKIKRAQDILDAGTAGEKELAKAQKTVDKLSKDIEDFVGKDNVVAYENFAKENGSYSNRFLKKRTGAEGYSENFWKSVDVYQNAANTKINLEPAMQAMAKAKDLTPDKGMQKFFQTEIDKMRGTKADVDRAIDDFSNSLFDALPEQFRFQNAGTKTLRGFRNVQSLAKIGFSITSAVNTLAQVSMLPGSVNLDGSLYGIWKGFGLVSKLAKDKLTKAETAEFKQMARMGIFEGSSHILPEETFSKYIDGFNKAAFSGITGSDRFLRISTYYGAELKAKRMGLTGVDAERYIYERVNEVNQNFSKLEAPHAFRSQVAKTLGSLVTFAPGIVVRSAEIGAKSIKGAADIIGTIGGKEITRAQFLKDVDDISKGIFTALAIYGVGATIGKITGQSAVLPNFSEEGSFSTPATQFIFGNSSRSGLVGTLTSAIGDQYDEAGNNLTQAERQKQFLTDVLPSYLIPGYAQWKRSSDAQKVNDSGYSRTASGDIRYKANPDNNLQRSLFGQYSTQEGQDYINNLGRPGGGALSTSQTEAVLTAPQEKQQMYYDFFKAADSVTGRSDANSEITQLYRDGKANAATRKAAEYNAKVDVKMEEFFKKYPYIDDELKTRLRNNVYITLTSASESARTK